MKIRRSMEALKTAIEKSLAREMEQEDYKKEILKKFSDSDIEQGSLKAGEVYHNPPEEEHTSDREAYGGITWVEYWRRLTGFEANHLKCSFCRTDIFFDVDSIDAFSMRIDHPKTRKEAYQAEGGHYYKNGKDNKDGYIIIPVCKVCNGRAADYDLIVKEENQFVAEIGATIKQHE